MRYLLDTNSCVAFLRDRNSTVGRRLTSVRYSDVVLCAVVKAELYYGARRSSQLSSNLAQLQEFFAHFASLPFDDRAAEEYGHIRAELAQRGLPIGPNDLMISAIALASDATLVTHNTSEFSRVQDLRLEDWEQPA